MRGTKLHKLGVLEFKTKFVGDNLATGKNGDIAEHLLAAVAKAGGLNSNAGKGAAELVEDKCGKRLSLNVLGYDKELFTRLNNLFKQGKQILNIRNFLVSDKNERVVKYGFHLIGIGCHVWCDVTAVKLHTLNNVGICVGGFGLLNGYNAVGRDLIHRLGNKLADIFVARRDCSNSGNIGRAVYLFGICLYSFDSGVNGLFHALAKYHRICAGCNVLHTLVNKRLSQNGCGSCTVAGDIVGFGSNLFYKLGSHILERVIKLDFFCDCNAVVGNKRGAKIAVKYNVSALRA